MQFFGNSPKEKFLELSASLDNSAAYIERKPSQPIQASRADNDHHHKTKVINFEKN